MSGQFGIVIAPGGLGLQSRNAGSGLCAFFGFTLVAHAN